MACEVLRVSATGSDGAGKDTAWRNAKAFLPTKLKILKIGKPTSIVQEGEERYVDIALSKKLDEIHEWADAKKNKQLTSFANMLYVMFQWRYQEPVWLKLVKPDMVFSLRDAYADPAAYAPFYMPNTLGKLDIEPRLEALHKIHGSPFRDKTIFLDIDPIEAVRRIDERIKRENEAEVKPLRPKWRHQHENVEDLSAIRLEFIRVLNCLKVKHNTCITTIDVTNIDKNIAGKALAREIID